MGEFPPQLQYIILIEEQSSMIGVLVLVLVAPALALVSRMPEITRATSSLHDLPMRIGHGFDIHRSSISYRIQFILSHAEMLRLIEGTPLVIGGVTIPYKLGADAHSDGDAMYHSIVDSILGALTLPDIGQLFPDNDPNWKGADSSIFMEEAYKRMDGRGYRIGNLDVTLILQSPKVKDIKPAMKENIVRLLRTSDDRVNIKARTHEKVDSIGEGRSYACHVVVLLEKKP